MWIRSQDVLGTTSVSVGELLSGARRLPRGRRRERLIGAIEQTLEGFGRSVLHYDDAAARTYARFQERRRAAGIPLAVEDGMIAAICSVRALTLATRNTEDFRELDIALVDPWRAGR